MREPVASIEHDWQRFSALACMVNHWDRHGWWPGRAGYYWYLTFELSPELQNLASHGQAIVRNNPLFDLVPLSDLHLTLDRLAFEDEISEASIQDAEVRVAEAVAGLPALRLRIGPLAGSSGALSFTVTPYDDVARLRRAVMQASRSSDDNECSDQQFRPHVGIAYCNTPGPAAPVITAVRQVRDLPPVDALVQHVALVRLTRRDRAYRWSVRRSFALSADLA